MSAHIPSESATSFSVATYNIHAWMDVRGRCAPDQTVQVLKNLDADIVALQEVESPCPGTERFTVEELARELGMELVRGGTMLRRDAHYGNLLLSRFPVISTSRHDISTPGREPRGVIDAELSVRGTRVRILATHLGLAMRERVQQMNALMRLLDNAPEADSDIPTVLLGDFNEWRPFAPSLRRLERMFSDIAALRSFPSRLPLLAFDRVMVRGLKLMSSDTHRQAPARHASDHLPVKAGYIFD